MFCTNCGREMVEGDRYCGQCGRAANCEGPRPQTSFGQPPKLERDIANKKIAGVCSGLAKYLGTDVTLVRIVFLTAFVLSGLGLIAYIIAWICMPRNDVRAYQMPQAV